MLAAWRDYLAHWNRGRGVVLVGHSQGAFMLERLLRDRYGSIKHLLVSALLLGGDVAVGGDERFAGVPACRALGQTGCIVAYSTWGRTPPPDAGLEASAALPVAFPELYTARCVRQGETPRPTVRPVLSPRLGLHAADVNIALGALINLIRAETRAYAGSH